MATTGQRETVVGMFRTQDEARAAIEDLKNAGYSPNDISLLATNREDTKTMAHDTGTHAGDAAVTGAVAGGLLGGMGGWLVGIGALAIPGIGPFIAAGAIATALTGAAVGAGVGAIGGALVGMGIPKDEADWYEQEVKGGGTLVAVKAGSRYDEAQSLLRRSGAYDIEQRGATAVAAAPAAVAGRLEGTARPSGPATAMKEGEQTLHLHEEELRATKERVQTGEVRVGKEVVEEQKTIDVPTTRQEVYVERRPGDRQPDAHPIGERTDETIRVPVTEERVGVEKVSVETEQVTVGTRAVQETQRVTDTVRHEEAKIENTGATQVAGASATTGTQRWEEVMPQYRTRWQQRAGTNGGSWADSEPNYRYGWQMANDPRYRGKTWTEVEPDLRRDWGSRNPTMPWDRAGQAIHDVWDTVANRA